MTLSALYVYEYICTIDQEVAVIWSRKATSSTLLFLFNRYVALTGVILGVIPIPVRLSVFRMSFGPNALYYKSRGVSFIILPLLESTIDMFPDVPPWSMILLT